ncbi:MAG: hypothetical protein K2J80_14460 [Oscillospiraceae bacterium]|nr:hypothetical protein [Oscillospiraceae bacterium]
MDTAEKEAIKKFFSGFSNPAALMDNRFVCVYSNKSKLLPQDKSMMAIFQKTVTLPLTKSHITMAMINGCFYGVRIVPFNDELYFCEFFDRATLLSLAENTDIYDKLLPVINGVEYNTAALWRGYSNLKSRLEGEDHEGDLGCAAEMEKHLISLHSYTKNISEYLNMLFYTPKTGLALNLASIMTGIVGRCNTVLAASNRYVDYVCEESTILINAESRHVAVAVINALQNALMYSTRDCIPYVTLFKPDIKDCKYAVLKILNNSAMYIDNKNGSETEFNFGNQRLGYGIPIIKRFAELVGGSFSMHEENGMISTEITLPLVEDTNANIGVLNSSRYIYYKTDIPDILELKMMEVNELFKT